MLMKVVAKQYNSKMCFVCGFDNMLGLKTRFFELEDKSVCSLVSFREEHQSYPERLHGGISAAVLDETIGRAMMSYTGEEAWGVTTSLNIKYLKPVSLNKEIRVLGKIISDNGRMYEGVGMLLLEDGSIAVKCSGKYLKMPIADISSLDPNSSDDWAITKEDNDPKEIDLPDNIWQKIIL